MKENEVSSLTKIVYSQLCNFPFHNLGQLLNITPPTGGTCFDHALKLKSLLSSNGYVAKLCEAEVCLTGNKTHRLVSVETNNSCYFLDTGSGWPTSYVISTNLSNQTFYISGITFDINLISDHYLIRRYDGRCWQKMNRIPVDLPNESDILEKYNSRYDSPLPFSDSLRISWLTNFGFYRIVNKSIRFYRPIGNVIRENCQAGEIIQLVDSFFPTLTSDLKRYLGAIR